jgi:hypothetical protein
MRIAGPGNDRGWFHRRGTSRAQPERQPGQVVALETAQRPALEPRTHPPGSGCRGRVGIAGRSRVAHVDGDGGRPHVDGVCGDDSGAVAAGPSVGMVNALDRDMRSDAHAIRPPQAG